MGPDHQWCIWVAWKEFGAYPEMTFGPYKSKEEAETDLPGLEAAIEGEVGEQGFTLTVQPFYEPEANIEQTFAGFRQEKQTAGNGEATQAQPREEAHA